MVGETSTLPGLVPAVAGWWQLRPIADVGGEGQIDLMNTLSAPFVERTVNVDGQDVCVRFFQPEPDETSFFCRYEIDWPEGTRSKRAGGVDGVQALLLAMQIAHTDLLSARENHGSQVSWLNERSLGFPIADTIRDLDPDNTF